MKTPFLVAFALVVASAGATQDLPLYCRLLAVGLQQAVEHPELTQDINVSTMTHVPLMGDMDVSVSHLEVGGMKIVECDAYVNEHGAFEVSMRQLEINLTGLAWEYRERRRPHIYDHGVATGTAAASFHVTIDTANAVDEVFKMNLDVLDVKLGATRHPWLTAAVMKLLNFLRPVVSSVLKLEAKKVMDQSLMMIHSQGGCVFLNKMLSAPDFTTFSFTSYEPIKVHVPAVGDLYFSVNSTRIEQPTHMDCNHLSFSGERLVADIQNVPFNAEFVWSYQKPDSSFWPWRTGKNSGTGEAAIVAGTKLNIDLIKPSSTNLRMEVPELKLKIHADEHAWLYNAVTFVTVPLVKSMLTHFGGIFLETAIKKCLEDPTCPNLGTSVAQDQNVTMLMPPKAADIIV